MPVPFLDLRSQYRALAADVQTAITEVLETASYIQGPAVKAFEQAFAAYCGARGAVGVGSGTSALQLALQALDVGPGDEVIIPANTFVATAEAVSVNGARPRFVDIDPRTYQIDPAAAVAAITPRTKGIIPVHLYGHPAPMAALATLARQHRLWLLEDAAQAHGARHQGRRVGSLAPLACFSFYPGKNLGAYGDGGAVTGDDHERMARIRRLANHGSAVKYEHIEVGWCERLDSVQAAVLNVKLRHLDTWNAQRRQVATWYGEALAGLPVTLPGVALDVEPVWHLYVVQVADREAFQVSLKAAGIETGIHYPVPLPAQPCYADLGHKAGEFPQTEAMAPRIVSLPMYPEMTESQVSEVAAAIRRHYGQPSA